MPVPPWAAVIGKPDKFATATAPQVNTPLLMLVRNCPAAPAAGEHAHELATSGTLSIRVLPAVMPDKPSVICFVLVVGSWKVGFWITGPFAQTLLPKPVLAKAEIVVALAHCAAYPVVIVPDVDTLPPPGGVAQDLTFPTVLVRNKPPTLGVGNTGSAPSHAGVGEIHDLTPAALDCSM